MTGAPCAVKFCAAMAGADSDYCAIHREPGRREVRPKLTAEQAKSILIVPNAERVDAPWAD